MTLSPALRSFLDQQIVGVLATRSEQGHIHQSVVYYALQDDELLVSTEAGRHKARDIQQTGWASLCVMGHERPFPSVTLSGPATIQTKSIGPATAAIAQRFMDLDKPPEPQTDQALAEVGRVVIVIQIQRVGPASYIE